MAIEQYTSRKNGQLIPTRVTRGRLAADRKNRVFKNLHQTWPICAFAPRSSNTLQLEPPSGPSPRPSKPPPPRLSLARGAAPAAPFCRLRPGPYPFAHSAQSRIT